MDSKENRLRKDIRICPCHHEIPFLCASW